MAAESNATNTYDQIDFFYIAEVKSILLFTECSTLVDSLQAEKDEIDTCLNKMKTTQNKNKDKHNAQTLAELSKTEKDYQMLIKEERETIQQLDRQVKSRNVSTYQA